MVSTRSKTRRASTPLSSPPASPTPSSPGSPISEPAEESAASVNADSQPEFSDIDDEFSDIDDEFDSDLESDGDHEDHCTHHTSMEATHCNALTYTRKKCSRRARIFQDGFYPVCNQHIWSLRPAGRCQSIEECGRVCNRLAPNTPPYLLCIKHERGRNDLPCYIMILPIELRLMIFRYLLPDVVGAASFDAKQTAVLKVNRQFYQEATAVMYGESKFRAVIRPTSIVLFGRQWNRDTPGVLPKILDETLCKAGAQRIRHLEVDIHFGDRHKKVRGIGESDITHEEYELYQLRDTVRKLAQLLSREPSDSDSKALKYLEIQPKPAFRQSWGNEELAAAIFFILEPFLTLGPIENCALRPIIRPETWSWRSQGLRSVDDEINKDEDYRKSRSQWLGCLRGSVSNFNVIDKPRRLTVALAEAFSKIEDFVQLIHTQDTAQFQGTVSAKHGWTSSVFQGIERVLHLSRVALEDGDVNKLQEIHRAVAKRWIQAHTLHQQSLAAVAASVANLLDGHVWSVQGHDRGAFDFDEEMPVNPNYNFKDTWPELTVKDASPRFMNPEATIKEEGPRVIRCRDGEEQMWLKTPAVVRQLRVYKRYKEQRSHASSW